MTNYIIAGVVVLIMILVIWQISRPSKVSTGNHTEIEEEKFPYPLEKDDENYS